MYAYVISFELYKAYLISDNLESFLIMMCYLSSYKRL